jgi:hypothetical protein
VIINFKTPQMGVGCILQMACTAISSQGVTMLSKFNNEVLLRGPAAVLPQHLNHPWLKRLQQSAEEFLDRNFSLDGCKDPRDVADPLLSVCVYEILRHHHIDTDSIPTEEMIEKMAIYAISIVMEAVNRDTDIALEHPTLVNILSMERIVGFKKVNPDFIELLEKACVIRDSGEGRFSHI